MHRSSLLSLPPNWGEMLQILQPRVVLSRLELLTPTLSVWCSNQLSYRTVMELCVARNLVLHLLYSFINKGVAKEECGNIGPACLLQYLTSLPDSPAVSSGKEPFPVFSAVLYIY